MSKNIHLTVPEPCHENWNKMTLAERGRFCNACQKQVVDFTGMSDVQVATFFKKTSSSVCGRFMNDQLNRDLEIPKKRIPWLKYFFGFALPAFLFSAKAKAQGNVRVITGDTVIMPLKGKIDPSVCTAKQELADKVIKGKITDMDGMPIIAATIVVKGTSIATTSDLNGNFRLPYKNENRSIVLEASSIGFQTIEMPVSLDDKIEVTIEMMSLQHQVYGEVVIVAGLVIPKKKKEVPLIPHKIYDTALQKFKLFPNPVPSGSNINIEIVKEIVEGYYVLDIISQSGQSVYQREIWIDKEARIMNVTIPAIKPWSYYLNLTDKKIKKEFC